MLMIAIDNPTEAAAMQMMASLKLSVFFSKIAAWGLGKLPALSTIPLLRPGHSATGFSRLPMLCLKPL
jgi:hypothetical protein